MQLISDREAQKPLFNQALNVEGLTNIPIWFATAINDPTCTSLTTQFAYDTLTELVLQIII